MHKILGIYIKHKKPFLEKDFADAIEIIKKLCNPPNDNIYMSDNFFLMSYCDNKDEMPYYIKDDVLYSYSGYVYFHQYPTSDKSIDIERERFERIIAEEKSGSHNIEGNYNIIKYDLKKNRLSIRSDVLGLNTLFCYEDKDVFMFCSDYEPLVKYKDNKYMIDVDAIYEYIMVKSPQNGRTFFKNITIFPRNKTYYISPYFSRYKSGKRIRIPLSKCSVTEITEKYFNALKEEVRCMLEWYPDIPVCLTGGADTRMILGCMNENQRARHTFVTIRNRNIIDSENQDVVIAKKLASKYMLKHETIDFDLIGMSYIDDVYFKRLISSDVYVISGFCGSETIDLQQVGWILSELCLNIIGEKNEKNSKGIFEDILLGIVKYVRNNSLTFKQLRKDVLSALYRTNVANNLELYIPMFFYRSFFSCVWGGGSGNTLMPGIILRHHISPFISQKCMNVLFSASEYYLGKKVDNIRNLIFKNHLCDFTDIESNSNLCDNKDCVLTKTTVPKDQSDYFKVDYENIDHIFDNEYTKNLNVFNLEQIKKDYYDNKRNDSHVFLDLLLWFNYVSTI